VTDTVLYYEDFTEIKKKIWSMLTNAVKDRGSPFRIPVFICGNQSDFDGRIVVLRKADEINNLVQYHSDIRSDKIAKLKANKMQQCYFMIKKKRSKLD
jgi:3-hydroxyisobutyrate dehydrogenase